MDEAHDPLWREETLQVSARTRSFLDRFAFDVDRVICWRGRLAAQRFIKSDR